VIHQASDPPFAIFSTDPTQLAEEIIKDFMRTLESGSDL
jgi:hypothetical protein